MQLQTLDLGNIFTYAGKRWILLDRREEFHLCIAADNEGPCAYDGGLRARFDEAAISGRLNGAYFADLLQNGGTATDFNSLLMNLSVSMTVGDCIRSPHVGLLSWHQRLRYDTLIPRVWHWEWTCTISDGIYGSGLRCVAGKPQNYAYFPPNHPDPVLRSAISLRGWAEVGKE